MINRKSTGIILIHGLWLTPRSWESLRTFYEERGYKVLTPAWPRIHGEIDDIRRAERRLSPMLSSEL